MPCTIRLNNTRNIQITHINAPGCLAYETAWFPHTCSCLPRSTQYVPAAFRTATHVVNKG